MHWVTSEWPTNRHLPDPSAILRSSGGQVRPDWASELNVQDGTAFVQRSLFSDEGWSLPANDPDLNIRWLLPNERRHHARDPSQLKLDLIMHRLTWGAD